MSLKHHLTTLWNRVLEIGVRQDMDPGDARHVRITNALAFSSSGIAFSYLPSTWYLFRDHELLGIAIGSIVALQISYALILLLNRNGQHWLAPTLLAGLVWIHVFVTTFTSGSDTGLHLYFMAYALGTTLLFAPRYQKTRLGFMLLGILSLALSETIAPEQPTIGLELPAIILEFQSAFILCGIYVTVAILAIYYDRETHRHEALLQEERRKSDTLLLNVLPAPIAERLKSSDAAIADRFEAVSVLFADLVGFTHFSDHYADTPEVVVALLNDLFRTIDAEIEAAGCEKIKTIGDAYMVASGVPQERPDHALAAVELARKMIAAAANTRAPDGTTLQMRIGIHSGPVVAGVIGSRKFAYDLWGDTVNTASRMESHGEAGRIHVSEITRALVADQVPCSPRGTIEIKGKGQMQTWFVD